MTLDDMLGNLVTKKGNKWEVNSNYAPSSILEAAKGLDELRKADLSTKDGLKAYSTLTGDNPTNYSAEKLDLRKEARSRGGQISLSSYVDKHFKNVIGELDEAAQVSLGFQYCPRIDISGNNPYNATRGIVIASKETLEQIERDPDKFFTEELKKETPLMGHYMTMFTREFLDISQREARQNASLAITKYNPAKFLIDTKGLFQTHYGEAIKIQEAIRTKIEVAQKNHGTVLTAAEIANLTSAKQKDLEKFSEAGNLSPFITDVTTRVVNTLISA